MAKSTVSEKQHQYVDGAGQFHTPVVGSTTQAGLLKLDGTPADIQPVGASASAGSNGAAADSGHVHPSATWVPADNNLLIATSDPGVCSNAGTPVAGTLYLIKLTARTALTISNLWFGISSNSSGSSTGSYAGLYSSSGTELTGSSDVGALFNSGSSGSSGSWAECALTTPQAVTAGSFVWAALLLNISSMPSLYQGPGGNTGFPSAGLAVSTARWAVNGTSLTSLPPSVTPASNSFIQRTFWCGGS